MVRENSTVINFKTFNAANNNGDKPEERMQSQMSFDAVLRDQGNHELQC